MTWKKGTIKLAAAQAIFHQFDIQPIMSEIDPSKPIGYSALIPGHENRIKSTGLTDLCTVVVEKLTLRED